ncbi:MAG: Membrane protein insertase YidC [Acidobacteria bacterium ADurb.Bin340]|nr:MAG: Membrane protein insertase YidC [Acidobacteria bacterium ADurb.Bin340]
MNANKNTLLFVVLSMALLGLYYLLMGRATPPPPKAPPAAVAQAPASVPAPVAASAPVASTPSAVKAPSTAPGPDARLELENATLKLAWRKQDGTLVQAHWKADGTSFFPEGGNDSLPFLGLGGAIDTYFEGEPEVRPVAGGREVVFRNSLGDQLAYRVPDAGDVLDVKWSTQRGTHLFLVRKPLDVRSVAAAARVFTLQDKGVEAHTWASIMKDPWYSFVGGKKKPLPQATTRVGIDAGIEKNRPAQTFYFAAIWESSRMPERDTERFPGYHVAPASDGTFTARLYLGPKQAEQLAAFGQPYTQVVDFGFFGMIAKFLFWIVRTIQRVIPNWGWAIVVFSILLRLALWPLNTKTITSMLRMKDLEPHQKALQAKYEKYGSDMQKKAEMQKELMAFYKKNGYNPMGGCLPMLLQMPVFFALWSALNAVFELRHAPFIFWIQDLSARDPFFVLPVLLGASMVAQSAMTPAAGDPMQRKMMMWLMPAMMVFFFAQTPAGLCVYYLTFSLVHMAQTWWIMRTYKSQPVVL